MRMLSCSFFKRRSKKPKASWAESAAGGGGCHACHAYVAWWKREQPMTGTPQKIKASRTAGLFLAAHRISALKLD